MSLTDNGGKRFKKWIGDYFIDRFFQWRNSREQHRQAELENQKLLLELRQAQRDWQLARQKMDYVDSPDQVDYAVFYYEATIKRYEMLLRTAKKRGLRVSRF